MDTSTMLVTATYLLIASALGGVVMAVIRFSGTPRPPLWFAMGHGIVACAGMTLLIYAAIVGDVPSRARIAAVLFVAAATGGSAMNLLFHSKGLPLPKTLVVGHGIIAVVALGLLWSVH